MENLAVFDFDGTLCKGYSSIEFLNYLKEKKVYNLECYAKQMKIIQEYREGKLSYEEWCKKWGLFWAEGMKGKLSSNVKEHAINFFMSSKKNIYPEAYKLISYLKEKDYEVIILSVGAIEVISLASEELSVKKTYSTKLQIKDGIYTGKITTAFHDKNGKEVFLQHFLKNKKFENTVGFGDSDTDIGFMKILKTKIALHPSQKMKDYCIKHEWNIADLNNFDYKMLE